MVSFNTSGTKIFFFLFFIVFTGTGIDPSSAVSVHQSPLPTVTTWRYEEKRTCLEFPVSFWKAQTVRGILLKVGD